MEIPADDTAVIGVAASNIDRARGCFSNAGDVAAPGGDGDPPCRIPICDPDHPEACLISVARKQRDTLCLLGWHLVCHATGQRAGGTDSASLRCAGVRSRAGSSGRRDLRRRCKPGWQPVSGCRRRQPAADAAAGQCLPAIAIWSPTIRRDLLPTKPLASRQGLFAGPAYWKSRPAFVHTRRDEIGDTVERRSRHNVTMLQEYQLNVHSVQGFLGQVASRILNSGDYPHLENGQKWRCNDGHFRRHERRWDSALAGQDEQKWTCG